MKVLYISRSIFPYGAAYASRVMHFAKMLHHMGHTVHIITDYTLDEEAKDGKVIDMEFCTYQALFRDFGIKSRMQINKKRYECVKKYLDTTGADYIITSSFPFDYKKMKNLMQDRKIPYALELCEWYDPSIYKFGKADIRYWINQKTLGKKYVKENKIIAISRYLQNYYEKCGVSCIRIPTILDLEELGYREDTSNEKIKIMYAGNPGKSKELLKQIFEAIADLKQEDEHLCEKLCFDIYGVNEEQVVYNIENDRTLLESVRDCIQIQGKVKQEIMNSVYQEHDYSIFMRPHRRSSEAGFPTKLAESLAAGTPVLVNQTGDISCYIENGENGYLVENDREEIKKLFRELISMEKSRYTKMRKNARKTAECSFDYRVYEKEMDKFINE